MTATKEAEVSRIQQAKETAMKISGSLPDHASRARGRLNFIIWQLDQRLLGAWSEDQINQSLVDTFILYCDEGDVDPLLPVFEILGVVLRTLPWQITH